MKVVNAQSYSFYFIINKMIEVTFMFRTSFCERSFGKIQLRYCSDDHNGIDQEIYPHILKALCSYHDRYDSETPLTSQNLVVSVLGTSVEWTSEKDRGLFDIFINCMDRAERHHYFIYRGKSRYLYRDEDYNIAKDYEDDDEDDYTKYDENEDIDENKVTYFF